MIGLLTKNVGFCNQVIFFFFFKLAKFYYSSTLTKSSRGAKEREIQRGRPLKEQNKEKATHYNTGSA
jgi:hypothetical protein